MTKEWIRRKIGDRPSREYLVSFVDDSPERAEAIAFFSALERPLPMFPSDPFPPGIDDMPFEKAQAYLDLHPTPKRWELLSVPRGAIISDSDLSRLRYIPELRIVKILSDRISDQGVRHLSHLFSLEILCLYSQSVTDACLEVVSRLHSLRMLDMQLSPAVSRSAFEATVSQLPALTDRFPPHEARATNA